jgi:hypothetical protein
MKRSFLALLAVLACHELAAQRTEVGFFGGVSYYMGDLNPKNPFEMNKPAYGLVYRYNFHNRIALKGNLTRGKVEGNDLITGYREERALNFSSEIYELAVMMEFNFLNYFTGSEFNYVSPYIFGGIGVFMFDPKASYNGVSYNLRNLQTENNSYSRFALAMPFGIGVKYSLYKNIGLSLEWGMRRTSTDYLDDVSTVYPAGSTGSLQNPVPAFPVDPSGLYGEGMQRGNSKDNDWYSFAGLSVVFRINSRGNARCDEPEKIRF